MRAFFISSAKDISHNIRLISPALFVAIESVSWVIKSLYISELIYVGLFFNWLKWIAYSMADLKLSSPSIYPNSIWRNWGKYFFNSLALFISSSVPPLSSNFSKSFCASKAAFSASISSLFLASTNFSPSFSTNTQAAFVILLLAARSLFAICAYFFSKALFALDFILIMNLSCISTRVSNILAYLWTRKQVKIASLFSLLSLLFIS